MANRRNTNSTNDINNTCSTPTVVTSNGRHPVYHGIRRRADKWVSEIRNNSSRIWLGTYPTPEMAAAAYDAAALVLKGSYALLNFPDSVLSDSGTLPECPTVDDIRAAAATAAAARQHLSNDHESEVETTVTSPSHGELMDHDTAVFDSMPNMLSYMAEGMMMSPPRMSSNYYLPAEQGDSSGGGWNLWSY